MKILLTGATGFLGRHTLPILEAKYGEDNVVAVSSSDYDLMDPRRVDACLADHKPDTVIHYAAYSGGIGANRTYPADFYYKNTILTANMFEYAARRKVKKLIYPMGGCSYPATAKSPIDETQLWQGYPQPESAGYSTAKMMGTVAAQSYHTQYGLDATVIIPGNMYGEYDNFRKDESHVVPAFIRRYYETNKAGEKDITMWGSGKPERDFVYAGDVAALIPYFIEEYEGRGPINISSGTRTSIKELSELIAEMVKFKGIIKWDTDKPDGQMVKIFDTTQMEKLGLSCPTSMRDGLQKTIDWFATHYDDQSYGLRI